MTRPTARLLSTFHDRIGRRRRMLSHLGIPSTGGDGPRPAGWRQSLLECLGCTHPEVCTDWIDRDRPGCPYQCPARDALRMLSARGPLPGPQERRAV